MEFTRIRRDLLKPVAWRREPDRQAAALGRSTAKRHRPQMLGHRAQHGRRQEQQRPDQQDRAQQHEAERERVGAQRADGERRRLLRRQAAASASGAMIGMKRPNSITRPVAMSQCGLYGRGGVGRFGSLKPQVSPRPSKPEPLLAEAELNSYRISEKPCAPGLLVALLPQSRRQNRPVGPRIRIGWISRASMASFISRASTFLPRYSGVRPTISPARKTPTIR